MTNWPQRFDEQFPRFKDRAFTEDTADVLKSFISDLLKEVIEEIPENPHRAGEEFKGVPPEFKQQLRDKYL